MTLPAGLYAHFTTSEGAFVARLFEEEAPKTVANFAGLADGSIEWQDPVSRQTIHRPFYDGLIFHRVIDGFVIQGGCPMGNGMGGPGFKFERRVPPVASPQQGRHPVDGQRRPGHQRQPVLRHPRADAAPRRPPLGLR